MEQLGSYTLQVVRYWTSTGTKKLDLSALRTPTCCLEQVGEEQWLCGEFGETDPTSLTRMSTRVTAVEERGIV